jgi:hypothetical protein
MKPIKIIAQVEIPRELFEAHVRDAIWSELYPDLKNWSDLKLTPQEEQAVYTCAESLFEEAAGDALNDWGELYDDEQLVFALCDSAEVLRRRMDALLNANRDVEAEEDKRAIERLTSRGYKVQKS